MGNVVFLVERQGLVVLLKAFVLLLLWYHHPTACQKAPMAPIVQSNTKGGDGLTACISLPLGHQYPGRKLANLEYCVFVFMCVCVCVE